MIHKLRRKFILINMTLVCLVMIIVFLAISLFSYQWFKSENVRSMERLIFSAGDMVPHTFEIGDKERDKPGSMVPIFSVKLDSQGEILSVMKDNVTIADDLIEKVTARALASGKQEGILFDLQLRFIQRQTPDGWYFAFADMTRELDSLTNLLTTLLLVGLGGLLAFFLISMFLSKWALRPVEKAWEQQRQFVADASHELKTPLTVILANMGILLSHKDDAIAHQQKWVENTQAEAVRMKTLVDNLLFLAKSDASSQEVFIKSSLDFSDLIWSSLLPIESLAFEQGVTITNEITPGIMLVGDEGQLKQLVILLLDNACKYAGEKGVVTVKLDRIQDHVRLTVNNTGEPIRPDQLNRIFERFYRPDQSRARDQGGYGLGLAIGQAIVKSHAGKISVESSQEAGTTFTVTLPL